MGEHAIGSLPWAYNLACKEIVDQAATISEQRAKLGFLADLTEVCGMSWNGFNIKGDSKSIDEVRRLENRSSQLEVYRAAYDERVATKDATIARLRAALLEIRNMTDADNEESYRVDDREGCLDTVHHTAKTAMEASR